MDKNGHCFTNNTCLKPKKPEKTHIITVHRNCKRPTSRGTWIPTHNRDKGKV